jgi:tetratricopeptide (TPR) repeat protein
VPASSGGDDAPRQGAPGGLFTLRDAAARLGLSRWMVRGLIAQGFVKPQRGARGEYRFSFQDLVLLRTAMALRRSRIAPRRIIASLARLRERLPETMPLTGLRIAAIGNEVVVRDGSTPWQAESGQRVFDFELPGSVAEPAAPRTLRGKTDWFLRGVELEARDPKAAMAAYRRAIAAHPERADAYLNLGVLLGDAGRRAEAIVLYGQALAACPREALLHFNLAVALEDAGDTAAAIGCYERGLALDPALADAHFNLARLFDKLGENKRAIRHYSAYKRLTAQR